MTWTMFGPELLCFSSAMVLLALSLRRREAPRTAYLAALALSALVLAGALWAVRAQGELFAGALRVDLFSQVFKVVLAMGLFLVVALCSPLEAVAPRRHPEFYLLLFTCTLAMMLLVGAVHLLAAYVALELSSYSLYVLVALRRTGRPAVAAAFKYFLIGISASALMLFGLALIYAATGAVTVAGLAAALPAALGQPAVAVGLVLTLGGFFFKLAAFPFHFWAPDVYQGAANQAAAYIATASKVAAIGVIVRVAAAAGGGADGAYLADTLAILAVVSMTVGNLAAVVQKDLKRLLAYSSIAQAGYVLIGVLSLGPEGFRAAVFYALALLVMKFTCFLVVVAVAEDGGDVAVADLAGLHRRAPLLAMALMLAVFSLAGIPPTIGFTGKFLIFGAAIRQGHLALVIIAMLNVALSLYYYLRVIRAAYLLEPAGSQPPLAVSKPIRALTLFLVLFIVAGGFYPQQLIAIAEAAAKAVVMP